MDEQYRSMVDFVPADAPPIPDAILFLASFSIGVLAGFFLSSWWIGA